MLSHVVFALAILVHGFNINDQVGADIDYGSFQNPSNHVRPRFRYWVPDASVDPQIVNQDIIDAAARGVGGVEFLGYYGYGGGELGELAGDWSTYGWGTPAWKDLFDAALWTTQENDLLLDFPLGPNQGAGVPAPAGSAGLLWELLPYNVSIPLARSYKDVIPGWGSGELVAVSVGLVLDTVSTTLIDNADFSHRPTPGNKTTLGTDSLLDLTNNVTDDGQLSYSFPSSDRGIEYVLFAYYQSQSGYREATSPEDPGIPAVPQAPVTSYLQNGSFVVDHFSATGAQVVTDFWEEYLLPGGTQELLEAVGNYGWEDSQEIGAGVTVWWTPSLLERFASVRSYDLRRYLPLIFYSNNGVNGVLPTRTWYVTDEPDQGQGRVDDYRQTLTELNQDYITALSSWCQNSLQSQFSAQVGYNLQQDMLAQIPYVNAPETESLDFNHLVDAFRQYSGPANLANKRIISSELGAERQQAFQESISEILWNVKRSVAGGVNQFVFHGQAYSGEYPGCTWPGFTTFAFRFSEMHGPQQPGWDYYSDFLNWTARTQWVAQSGVPRFDLVFWLKNENWTSVVSKYTPSDLDDVGFTYQYLSPDNLDLPDVSVSEGLLAPDKQAFKAFIVRANDSLTVSGVDHLVEYARAGLPITFSGGVPGRLFGYNATATQTINASLSSILDFPNVHVVDYDGLADSLLQLGITPRVTYTSTSASNNTLYSNYRYDSTADISYITLYNDATELASGSGSYVGDVTIEAAGSPYTYDAYTGNITPLFIFSQSETRTTLPVSLAGNQSTIVAFDHSQTPSAHIVAGPSNIFSITLTDTNQLSISLTPATDPTASQSLTTSNVTVIELTPPSASTLNLTTFTLTIESWAPPANLNETEPVKTNATYSLTSLIPWSKIDSPRNENVSGRGYYSTTFDIPAEYALSNNGGAVLEIPPWSHTFKVEVNSQQLPPVDIDAPIVDIRSYLNAPAADGSSTNNTLLITISTPLSNAARAVWGDLRCLGLGAQGSLPAVAEYGLVGPVRVVPLTRNAVIL